jgi:sugar phosphate isomerase/epimerase
MDNAEKSAEARLIPGCCAYSYNEDLRHGTMTLEDFILKAKDLRVLAVDMTGYYLKSTELRNLAYRHGVAFSGAACGVSMVQADAVSRAESLKQINKWVDVTDTLGASHLRIFAGNLPPGSRLKGCHRLGGRDDDDPESEVSSLAPKPHLGTFQRLLSVSMEDGFVV